MKKLFLGLLTIILITAAILVFRATTTFNDQQLEPATGIGEINLDQSGAVQRFSRALTYPTISDDDRSNFDAGAFRDFHAFLETSYPLVHERASKTVVSDYSLVYHLPGSDPSLQPVLYMGHMDVVPIEEVTRGEWTHPPFDGVVDDGIIWGRGSVDDKITLIALMEAMELLLSEGTQPRRSIYFAFGHDEEVGGKEGAAEVAKYFKSQGITFEYVMDEGCVVLEGMIPDIDQQVAIIGVSEKGYVNLVLTVNSPGGHSSQPPEKTAL